MYQRTIIIGRLGRDCEMRYTPGGDAVATFSVATDKRWTDKDGQAQQKTVWFRVTAWRKLAEICNSYLKKGAQVMVEGEMAEPHAYLDKSGSPACSLDITAQTMKMLGSREQGESVDEEAIPF